MPTRQLTLDCPSCGLTPHNQQTPNHVVHGIVSVFLLGLWIPVWIMIALTAGNEPAQCVKCGNKRTIKGPMPIPAATQAIAYEPKFMITSTGGAIALLAALMGLLALGVLYGNRLG